MKPQTRIQGPYWRPTCSSCGWAGTAVYAKTDAEQEAKDHTCATS